MHILLHNQAAKPKASKENVSRKEALKVELEEELKVELEEVALA
jgi:hypothetical protein